LVVFFLFCFVVRVFIFLYFLIIILSQIENEMIFLVLFIVVS